MVVNNKTNSSSIYSLILGSLSILIPFIGLILGILGIVISRNVKKEIVIANERADTIATTGFICSIAGIIIQMVIILSFILFTRYIGETHSILF